MDIHPNGLPIHADATVDIRSRIFLEGNFYVDLHPGTPARADPPLGRDAAGAPTPPGRSSSTGSSSALTPTRAPTCRRCARPRRRAERPPTAAEDATQDPTQRGLTGGQALNQSLKYSAGAFKASAIVNQALLGSQPHDLSGVVQGNEQVFRAWPRRRTSAQRPGHHVQRDDGRAGSPASTPSGRRSRCCPPLLRTTDTADRPLDASFGPTQAFAARVLPGHPAARPDDRRALPWLPSPTRCSPRQRARRPARPT